MGRQAYSHANRFGTGRDWRPWMVVIHERGHEIARHGPFATRTAARGFAEQMAEWGSAEVLIKYEDPRLPAA